jgi:CDP-diacylglycerol--glycerol-3-phosphate 3-phosphatidyltransferase
MMTNTKCRVGIHSFFIHHPSFIVSLMPSVYGLKPRFQNLLRPLMRRLAAAGLTPNAVTLTALAGSILVGAMVSQAAKHPALLLLLPAWLFARMALNAIDGMMARELGMATDLGAVLNELGDAISDLGLYLPLAFVDERAHWPVIAFAMGAVLTEFCGVTTRALGATRRYDGPMGKSDRAFVVGALGLVTFITDRILAAWPWIFAIAAMLTLLTCWNRLRSGLAELSKTKVRGG